jgi:hypothetical protein
MGRDPTMNYDVVIIGAGAAGLMCAIEAGKRGRSVLLLEHNAKIGEKIRISGGGRCNFTNLRADHANYLSANEHFCKSALARYPTGEFIALVEKHGIAYHEKTLGQLFCNESARQIIDMLLKECTEAGVTIETECAVQEVRRGEKFELETAKGQFVSDSLVIATGGLSIPQLGATNFAYALAAQFGLNITPLRPGLVPLTFEAEDLRFFRSLSGVSLDAVVRCKGAEFREQILFTHRGLSGPAILQISSYWREGEAIILNALPDIDALDFLTSNHQTGREIVAVLDRYLPHRFVRGWFERSGGSRPMNRYSKKELDQIARSLHAWELVPTGTEGFGKAEVTTGGIDTDELSSKTMEAKKVAGLFFVGECVDVTGWLGGYNFQWAWASGWVAGQFA